MHKTRLLFSSAACHSWPPRGRSTLFKNKRNGPKKNLLASTLVASQTTIKVPDPSVHDNHTHYDKTDGPYAKQLHCFFVFCSGLWLAGGHKFFLLHRHWKVAWVPRVLRGNLPGWNGRLLNLRKFNGSCTLTSWCIITILQWGVLSGSPSMKMSSALEFFIVQSPVRSDLAFEADEAFVQGQISTDGILREVI